MDVFLIRTLPTLRVLPHKKRLAIHVPPGQGLSQSRELKTRSVKAVRGLSVPLIYPFPAAGHAAKKGKSNADIQTWQEPVPVPVTCRHSSSSGIPGPAGTVRAPTMSSQPITNLRYFIPLFHGNITMAPSMPGLNEKSAPRFESSTDPEELERFF